MQACNKMATSPDKNTKIQKQIFPPVFIIRKQSKHT